MIGEAVERSNGGETPAANDILSQKSRKQGVVPTIVEDSVRMEMAYRDRRKAEIAAMRRVLANFAMKEECKWGKPTYTVDGNNVVIMQGFKEYFALGFFQGAQLKDPKKVLVQLGQTHAGREMKFTSVKDITAKAATADAGASEELLLSLCGGQAVGDADGAN